MQDRYWGGQPNYTFGFNGKENDDEAKGYGNQVDYGARIYDTRIGKFLSVDPIAGKFPFYSPYQYAGNSPIKFIDLDGAETKEDVSRFWIGQPKVNMTNAKNITSYNANGVPRAANWFFKEQLSIKPEMFSETNKFLIEAGRNPVVDETWLKYNPSHTEYKDQTLWHHHIEGGEEAVAIPEGLNNDYFSDLHPYLTKAGKALRGQSVSGFLNGASMIVGPASMFSGIFTGDPDSWINAFGFGEPKIGEIKRDWGNTNLYVQIMSIVEHTVPVIDEKGQQTIDSKTGKPETRLESKTVTANVYSGYIWNKDTKKFEGVNKIDTKTEIWKYDSKGNRTTMKPGPEVL